MAETKPKKETLEQKVLRLLDQRAKADDERFANIEGNISELKKAIEEGVPAVIKEELPKVVAEVLKKSPSGQPSTESSPSGAGGIMKFIEGILGGGSETDMVKASETLVRVADNLQKYRNPVLPYSPADLLLMKAGARSVYRYVYEGKKKSEEEIDKDIDEALGLRKKEEEHKT